MGMMERCMDGMGAMMGGGMMDGPPLFFLIPVLFCLWLLFLSVAAAVGVWAVRRHRAQNW